MNIEHSIAIGCDPNAIKEKEHIIDFLKSKGCTVKDFGSDDPLYANVANEVANAVASKEYDRGILICGTGLGVALAANKVKGAYAVTLSDVYSAERARKSNDANIACFGAFTVGIKLMETLVEKFLTSEFEQGCSSQVKVDCIKEHEVENYSR